MHETFTRHHRELQAAIDADPTGEGFIKDMFLYELENHEYSYTGTAEDALDSLGLTYENVAEDPRLARGLDLVEQDAPMNCYTDPRKRTSPTGLAPVDIAPIWSYNRDRKRACR